MGVYATPADLRAQTGDTAAALPDADAEKLLADAEDRVDELIGPAGIDGTTGRKITPASLAAWQRTKLTRATVLLAAVARKTPTAFDPPRYASVSGPDFSKSQPVGTGISGAAKVARRQAVALLNDSGLRIIGVRSST